MGFTIASTEGQRINTKLHEIAAVLADGQATISQILDQHGQRLEEHGQRLEEHGQHLEEHGQRLDRIEDKIDRLVDGQERIISILRDLDGRVEG